jgi:hypothetical protein
LQIETIKLNQNSFSYKTPLKLLYHFVSKRRLKSDKTLLEPLVFYRKSCYYVIENACGRARIPTKKLSWFLLLICKPDVGTGTST